MNLILWRHAAAEDAPAVDGDDDLSRVLTKRGRKQAEIMAAWLNARLPADFELLVSPAVRTRQTAEALQSRFRIVPELAPGASAPDVLAAVNWPHSRGTVVVVGHQPTLGMVASLLLSGVPTSWAIKKGAVWWIANRDREEGAQSVLRAVVTPDLA
jgi:phosphohistidine phosphatase